MTAEVAVYLVRCGYKNCRAESEPQPNADALEKWLRANRWKRVDGKERCPWCVLASRPNQGSWGPEK